MESDFQSSIGESDEADKKGEENLHHIINISLACENGLWYDFKKFTLISQTSFSNLLKTGKIEKYIDDPNHPIIGDSDEYNELCIILKAQIKKLHECMKVFNDFLAEVDSFSHLYNGNDSADAKFDGLAKVCFSSDPLVFLAMICIDKKFRHKLSDLEIWIKVWKMRFGEISYEPFENNLMITYLKIRSQKKFRVVQEFVSEVNVSEEYLETLGEKFDLVEGDEIRLMCCSKNKTRKIKIVRGKFVEDGKNRDTLLRGIVDNSYFISSKRSNRTQEKSHKNYT